LSVEISFNPVVSLLISQKAIRSCASFAEESMPVRVRHRVDTGSGGTHPEGRVGTARPELGVDEVKLPSLPMSIA
jgi:hypothetical protein